MQSDLTPSQLAVILGVDESEIDALIRQGKICSKKRGGGIRIAKKDVEEIRSVLASLGPAAKASEVSGDAPDVLPDGSRWCLTPTGVRFRVSGSVDDGAAIWPPKASQPIQFPKTFMTTLLNRFSGKKVSIGGRFDFPGRGSLGEFIQLQLGITTNPAVYLAAFLIEEGYADSAGRGYAQFLRQRRTATK